MEIDRIYKGDCLEGMAQLPNSSVDIVVTDPPYLIAYKTGRRKGRHKFKHEIINDHGEEAQNLIISYILRGFLLHRKAPARLSVGAWCD